MKDDPDREGMGRSRRGPTVVVAEGDGEGGRTQAVEAALEGFVRAYGSTSLSEIFVERFEGVEELEAALRAASTPSLTGEPKAVVLKCGSIAAAEAEEVCGWLEKATATPEWAADALLLLGCERALSPKARKRLEECGTKFVAPERPSHRDLPDFVCRLAREAGLNLASDAAAFLGSAVGSDTFALRSAVAQLADAYPPQDSAARIGLKEVQALFDPARHDPPWVLISAIERGDTAEALLSLKGFLDGRYHPLQVLAIVYTSCRRIAYLASAEGAHRELLASMKLPPAAKGRISKLSRRLGPDKARRLVLEIARAELDMKGRSGLDAETIVERLIVTLCEICH